MLAVDDERVSVDSAHFKSNGCGYMLAAAEVLAEYVTEKPLKDLHGLPTRELLNLTKAAFAHLPVDRVECVLCVINSVQAAFADMRSRRVQEFQGESALICTCFGITQDRIEDVIGHLQGPTVNKVSELTNAGTGCGSCRMLIQEIIEA